MPPAATSSPRRRRRRVGSALAVACVLVVTWQLGLPTAVRARLAEDHAFLEVDERGRPVSWDNCRAIHYRVNPTGAPAGWEGVLDDALDAITAASGYVFVLDGTTTDRAFRAPRGPRDPVLVAWAVRSELGPVGDTAAGVGGPVTHDTAAGRFHGSGIVVLDTLALGRLDRAGRREDEVMIAEHEFMHVLGLAHVEDPGQVMAPGARYGRGSALGEGDIAGLRALRAVPCPRLTS